MMRMVFCITHLLLGYEEEKHFQTQPEEPKNTIIKGPSHNKQIENPWIDKAIHEEVLERK